MSPLAHAVVSGFDEFLGELRADKGETLFSLTLFDTARRQVHVATPLADVPSLRVTGYHPDGMTALYDAVAHTVLATEERLVADGRAHEKVMVVVMTDGLENSSTDYDARSIARLIRSYDERDNWTFVYLGAAHATLAEAQDAAGVLAFERGNAMRWTADESSVQLSMGSLAGAARSRRASAARKTDRLFEEAGQSESDYVPSEQRHSFERRDLVDLVDPGE
jgi:uncharacterized protein YegL